MSMKEYFVQKPELVVNVILRRMDFSETDWHTMIPYMHNHDVVIFYFAGSLYINVHD